MNPLCGLISENTVTKHQCVVCLYCLLDFLEGTVNRILVFVHVLCSVYILSWVNKHCSVRTLCCLLHCFVSQSSQLIALYSNLHS